jgi:hypothetical protein
VALIERDRVYTWEALEELLDGIVSVKTLRDRLPVKRRAFKNCILGEELLRAWIDAPPFEDSDDARAPVASFSPSPSRARCNRPVRRIGAKDVT